MATELGRGNWAQSTNGRGEFQGAIDGYREPIRSRSESGFCVKCGAWSGALGLEPTPELFLEHIVQVFREVRRVLHPTGLVWCNMGDSYVTKPQNNGSSFDPKYMAGRQRGKGNRCNRTDHPEDLGLGLKSKDLVMMPARVAIALQEDGWILRQQLPWAKHNCLSGGAMVYVRCQKGDMPMTVKDMVRLNPATVKLWNGQRWTQALGWWLVDRPEESPEIELRSGERIGCTMEHRWPTQRGVIAAKEIAVGDVIESCMLPSPEPARSPFLIPDDVGWFCGLYLAEGSRSNNCIQIASHLSDRFDRAKRIAECYGGVAAWYPLGGNSATINIHCSVLSAVVDTYISGRLAHDKHLSVACWSRNNTFLSSLLDGYLGGDGHYDEPNDRWRLGFCENDALAASLRCLAARLDFGIRLKRGVSECEGKQFPVWRGEIRFSRKPNLRPTTFKAKEDCEVIAVRHSRARGFWDIAVEDEPHLFALASGILTHNSMPESTTDRPTSAVEYVYLFAKSEDSYYDREGVRVASSNQSHSRGSGVNPKANAPGPNSRINRDRDPAHQTDSKIRAKQNRSFSAAVTERVPTRALRNSDWLFASLESYSREFQGMVVDEESNPLLMTVNPKPFSLEMCDKCERIFAAKEYRQLLRLCLACHGLPPPEAKDCGCAKPNLRRLCCCGSTDWISHFATFPSRLVEPMLLAGTSRVGACPHCGAPYERVLQKQYVGDWHPDASRGHDRTVAASTGKPGKHDRGAISGIAKVGKRSQQLGAEFDHGQGTGRAVATENRFQSKALPEGSQFSQNRMLANTGAGRVATGQHDNPFLPPETLSWAPTCEHALNLHLFADSMEPVPCVVLDPFSGSGRTGLAAVQLGLDYIGIDRSPRYVKMSLWQYERLKDAENAAPLPDGELGGVSGDVPEERR